MRTKRESTHLYLIIVLALVVTLGVSETVKAGFPMKVEVKYGKFIGKGDGDSEFNMTPGVSISLGSVSEKKGFFWTIGYQELENQVGNSIAKGDLYTLSQFDYLFGIMDTIPNLFMSLGFGIDVMEFPQTDGDFMWTIPVGLMYRVKVWKRSMNISGTYKFVLSNSLGQNQGGDVAVSLPFY